VYAGTDLEMGSTIWTSHMLNASKLGLVTGETNALLSPIPVKTDDLLKQARDKRKDGSQGRAFYM